MNKDNNIDLKQCRREIDDIDKKLVELFEKRMNISLKVAEYKFNNNMEILNKEREAQVIEKNLARSNNEELKPYIEEFFVGIMKSSKQYQKKLIDEMNKSNIKE